MNKLTAAVLVATGLCVTATSVPAATYQYRGTLGIERSTAACGILPYIEQGNLFTAVYRPAGLGTNGDSTAIRVAAGDVNGDGIIAILIGILIESGNLTPNFQSAKTSELAPTEQLSLNFMEYTAAIRLLQQTPSSITEGTNLVTMKLQIRRLGNIPQCTVTFRGVLGLDKSTPEM